MLAVFLAKTRIKNSVRVNIKAFYVWTDTRRCHGKLLLKKKLKMVLQAEKILSNLNFQQHVLKQLFFLVRTFF